MPYLRRARIQRTGTFFCDSTTAQSLPRTPTDRMLAAVMALKAYSAQPLVPSVCHEGPVSALWTSDVRIVLGHTDLVEPTLIREDCDVSVVAGAACSNGIRRVTAIAERLTLPDIVTTRAGKEKNLKETLR